jgi:hypothetical protein
MHTIRPSIAAIPSAETFDAKTPTVEVPAAADSVFDVPIAVPMQRPLPLRQALLPTP